MKKLKKGQKAIRVTINAANALGLKKKRSGELVNVNFIKECQASLEKIQNELDKRCCSVDEYSNYYIEEHELTILILEYGDMIEVTEDYYEG